MKKFKFARICDATNRGINEGYCFGDGEMYFAEEKDLVAHLRTLEWENCNGENSKDFESNDDLLDFFYREDAYYYTEWEELDEDEWYESDHEDGSDAMMCIAW